MLLRQLLDTHMPDCIDLHSILDWTDAAVALLANRVGDAMAADQGSWEMSSAGTHQPDLATQTAPRISGLLIVERYQEALAMAQAAEVDSTERRGADHYLSTHMRAAAAFSAWKAQGDAIQLDNLQLVVEQLDAAPTRRHFGQAAAWLSLVLEQTDSNAATLWAERAYKALAQAYGESHPWSRSLVGTRLPAR